MWLSKEERAMLSYCYQKNPTGSGSYSYQELGDVLVQPCVPKGSNEVRNVRVNSVLTTLRNRELIRVDYITRNSVLT